jgi:predicted nucleic acid-binding protein
MAISIYVDANIYLDFLLARKNKQGIPLGPKAWNLFCRVAYEDYTLLVSLKTLEEIQGELKDLSKLKMLFEILKHKIKKIEYSNEELKEAQILDQENRNDALHAILANKHGAKYLVTRNTDHFKKFSHLIVLRLPESI